MHTTPIYIIQASLLKIDFLKIEIFRHQIQLCFREPEEYTVMIMFDTVMITFVFVQMAGMKLGSACQSFGIDSSQAARSKRLHPKLECQQLGIAR
jgi:hypothetical protein